MKEHQPNLQRFNADSWCLFCFGVYAITSKLLRIVFPLYICML
jgi:hypothetical protein